MAIIEDQVNNIKNSVIEMMTLASKQIARSQVALFDFNKDVTEEIIANEKKINAMDLKIDKDAEQTLALYNPVADDLRLIISVLSINTFLERIGDNAESIAKFINDFDQPFNKEIFEKLQLADIYENLTAMFEIIISSFEMEETQRAVKVFKMDKNIDLINDQATSCIAEIIKSDLDNIESYLKLLSVIRKLERVGDLLKNIAEETIFYVDAKVLKHKTKKKQKMIDEDTDSN